MPVRAFWLALLLAGCAPSEPRSAVFVHLPPGCRVTKPAPQITGDTWAQVVLPYGDSTLDIECGSERLQVSARVTEHEHYWEFEKGDKQLPAPGRTSME